MGTVACKWCADCETQNRVQHASRAPTSGCLCIAGPRCNGSAQFRTHWMSGWMGPARPPPPSQAFFGSGRRFGKTRKVLWLFFYLSVFFCPPTLRWLVPTRREGRPKGKPGPSVSIGLGEGRGCISPLSPSLPGPGAVPAKAADSLKWMSSLASSSPPPRAFSWVAPPGGGAAGWEPSAFVSALDPAFRPHARGCRREADPSSCSLLRAHPPPPGAGSLPCPEMPCPLLRRPPPPPEAPV